MGRYYILRDGKVLEEPNYPSWAEWYENHFKDVEMVAHTELVHGVVSTRFLAMNMTLARDAKPLVFETRVKGGWLDDQWERFASLDDARAGHEAWVARVQEAENEEGLPPPGAGW
jgi:hypothetical protein